MVSLLEADDELAALNLLDEIECTDGLPVILPTQDKVDRMVLAAGLDADLALGAVAPRDGVATVETVAANAVMAGCLPEHFPVVVAAIQALLDPEFDLAEVQATTNPVSPLLIVNGPARRQCGIASGHGALGPETQSECNNRTRDPPRPPEYRRRKAPQWRHGAARPWIEIYGLSQ